MYLTVVAMASLLMMAFNVNSNMNSSMNAYASIFSNIQNADDVGQSLECVIIVVGCDAVGSVGSSGDVIVGSGNDDNNTNGGNGGVIPVDPTECELCLEEHLTDAQLVDLRAALNLGADATLLEICAALDAVASVEALVLLLSGIGLTAQAILALLTCLDIEITLAEILAIIEIA